MGCKPRLHHLAACARTRAAFQKYDSQCGGTVDEAGLLRVLVELDVPEADAVELTPRVSQSHGVGGHISFDSFVQWWKEEGEAYANVPFKKLMRSHLRRGLKAGNVFSRYGDDMVDEFDGLKVIARNQAFSRYIIMISVVAIIATIIEEYGDLYDEEMIEGCTDSTLEGEYTIENCEAAGFGKDGCYRTWRLRKAAGVLGTALIFTFFFCILFTLGWIRYSLWRDQATVFELLQFRIIVSMRRTRYLLMLSFLIVQVLAYGGLKVWLTAEHEKGNFLEGGVHENCKFHPNMRVNSHAAAWYTIIYRGVMFVLVLQAPLRDIIHAMADLYYRLSLHDILRSGHPRPHRLIEAFHVVRFDELRDYLDNFAKVHGVRREGLCHRWPPDFMSRAVASFVEHAAAGSDGESGGIMPIFARRREKWQETMVQAYALAGLPCNVPGAECPHVPNCFAADVCDGDEQPTEVRTRRALCLKVGETPPPDDFPKHSFRQPETVCIEHAPRERVIMVSPQGHPIGLQVSEGMLLLGVDSTSSAAAARGCIGSRLTRVGAQQVRCPRDAAAALAALPSSSTVELAFVRAADGDLASRPEWVFLTGVRPTASERQRPGTSPPKRRAPKTPAEVANTDIDAGCWSSETSSGSSPATTPDAETGWEPPKWQESLRRHAASATASDSLRHWPFTLSP